MDQQQAALLGGTVWQRYQEEQEAKVGEAEADAEKLRAWQQQAPRNEIRRIPLRITTPPPSVQPPDQLAKFLAAWIWWTGSSPVILEGVAGVGGPGGQWDSHVDAQPGEVLLLPYGVAKILLTTDTRWQQMTVFPAAISPLNDPVTGLDMTWVAVTPCWGVDTQGPYFDSDNGAGGGDRYRLLVINGVPYLSNDTN